VPDLTLRLKTGISTKVSIFPRRLEIRPFTSINRNWPVRGAIMLSLPSGWWCPPWLIYCYAIAFILHY